MDDRFAGDASPLTDLLDRARIAVAAAADGERSPDPWGGLLWPEAPSPTGTTRILALDARLDFTRLTNAEPVVRAFMRDQEGPVRLLALGPEAGVEHDDRLAPAAADRLGAAGPLPILAAPTCTACHGTQVPPQAIGGIRVEDNVVVMESGPRNLTREQLPD